MYGRNVSKCTAPGTGDLGTWLVSNGYAVAYRLAAASIASYVAHLTSVSQRHRDYLVS